MKKLIGITLKTVGFLIALSFGVMFGDEALTKAFIPIYCALGMIGGISIWTAGELLYPSESHTL